MATRTVQGVLIKPDGNPIVQGKLEFRIQSGFTDDGVNVVVRNTCEVFTDQTGSFTINLHSGTNVKYLCTLPSLERFTFDLPESVTPLDLVTTR